MKTDFSDHYSIFAFSDHQITPVIAKAITRREFSERNKTEFCKALQKYIIGPFILHGRCA